MSFIIKILIKSRVGDTRKLRRSCPAPHFFCVVKTKKRRQREKRKGFKVETIKRLSPRSKYYCFSHSRASRIRKLSLSTNHGGRQYFLVFHGLTIWNPFRRPWNRCQMFPTCSYHLQGMKLVIKHTVLQTWWYGFFLLSKFEMNLSSWGSVTYNRSGLT